MTPRRMGFPTIPPSQRLSLVAWMPIWLQATETAKFAGSAGRKLLCLLGFAGFSVRAGGGALGTVFTVRPHGCAGLDAGARLLRLQPRTGLRRLGSVCARRVRVTVRRGTTLLVHYLRLQHCY